MSNFDMSKLLECDSLNCDNGYVTDKTIQSEGGNKYVVENNPGNLDKRSKFTDVKNIAIETNYLNYSDGFGVNNKILDEERNKFNTLTTFKGPHQLFLRTFVNSPETYDISLDIIFYYYYFEV